VNERAVHVGARRWNCGRSGWLAVIQTRWPTSHTTTAIVQVESHRPSLLVLEIRAKIIREDMGWTARQVDVAFDAQEKIDLLPVMTSLEGAALGAVFDGEAAGAMVRSLKHVRRYGVVGVPGWVRAMVELLKSTTPVEEKTFAPEELAEAHRWIDAA